MKKTIRLKAYHPEDAKALAALFYHTVHQVNAQHYTAEQLAVWAPASSLEPERWQQKWEKCAPIVATCEDQIVGFAELEINGHIDCFYVHYKHQGCGVGTVLMQEIDRRARAIALSRIYAEVSITAQPFFERKGFQFVKRQKVVRNGVTLTNCIMEKNINHAFSD